MSQAVWQTGGRNSEGRLEIPPYRDPYECGRPGETHLLWLKVHVSGFESSPYGVQWMRFDKDAPYPDIVESIPHVAFAVDDLAKALEGKEILIEPNCTSPGVTVAMIIDDGAPIELLEFRSILGPTKLTYHPNR